MIFADIKYMDLAISLLMELDNHSMPTIFNYIFSRFSSFVENEGLHVSPEECYKADILNNPFIDALKRSVAAEPNISQEMRIVSKRFETVKKYKDKVLNWPLELKLARLAIFTQCTQCYCGGWRPVNPKTIIEDHCAPDMSEVCQNRECRHTLAEHVGGIDPRNIDQINNLSSLLFDMEILYLNRNNTKDEFVHNLYHCIYMLARASISRSDLIKRITLNELPYAEKPNVLDTVANFLIYKYDSFSNHDFGIMMNITKTFLNHVNSYAFPPPSLRRNLRENEKKRYASYFARWMFHCYVPKFCTSMQAHEPAVLFGRQFLIYVFDDVVRGLLQLLNKKHASLVNTINQAYVNEKIPKFIVDLRLELFENNSPLWDPDHLFLPRRRKRATEQARI